ncbi:hypothetical protein [Litoreibacter janthinus]|uniref:DUF2867 domain-containing protein n=1 Tax=Litoreibacter janthinus TaxID=670154 RepID=A0A1I6H7Y6_9RHOB|nr:hypothetical protein [Litoreibacter janthinus]SFR50417.1 hypothetical protein SAMN04488002_2635 [Litoreibacter janthinus]
MPTISSLPLPKDALLRRYDDGSGHYTDCFSLSIARSVSLAEFVEAFYTAPLFRCERIVLKIAARRPSTDQDASDIAHARTQRFAAWDLEDRTGSQLLMCDMAAKTRSWFMAQNVAGGTQLYFGSAVTVDKGTGKLGMLFNALLPLHKLYARALLKGAARRLNQGPIPAAAQ